MLRFTLYACYALLYNECNKEGDMKTLYNFEIELPELPHYIMTIDEYLMNGVDLDKDNDVDEYDYDLYLSTTKHGEIVCQQ